jgi:hypothetical protein
VGSEGVAVAEFIQGIQIVFTISFIASAVAAFFSSRKGKPPSWGKEEIKLIQEEKEERLVTEGRVPME